MFSNYISANNKKYLIISFELSGILGNLLWFKKDSTSLYEFRSLKNIFNALFLNILYLTKIKISMNFDIQFQLKKM